MNSGAREYYCNVCGRIDNWGKGWRWYGSIKEQEELPRDEIIKRVVCSEKCSALMPTDFPSLKDLKAKKSPKVYRGPTVPDA